MEFMHWNSRTAHEKRCKGAELPVRSALGGLFKIVTVASKINSANYAHVLEINSKRMADILTENLSTQLKFYVSITLLLEKIVYPEERKLTKHAHFHTSCSPLTRASDIEEALQDHINFILQDIEEYNRNGTGWKVKGVYEINLWITHY